MQSRPMPVDSENTKYMQSSITRDKKRYEGKNSSILIPAIGIVIKLLCILAFDKRENYSCPPNMILYNCFSALAVSHWRCYKRMHVEAKNLRP